MVESLVRDSAAPLAAVELPSGRVLAANAPLAKVLGSTVEALIGSSSLDQLAPAERHSAELGFLALADGHLTGYQAIRTRDVPGNPSQTFSVWVNGVDVGGTRVGLISVTSAGGGDGEFRGPTPTKRELGDVVLGTVDGAWRIDRISQDVTEMLGITPEQCVGAPVLGAIHPLDAPGFLAAVEHARRGERSVALAVRLSAREPQWREVSAVFAVVGPEQVPPPMAFALIRVGAGAGSADGADRAGAGAGAGEAGGAGGAFGADGAAGGSSADGGADGDRAARLEAHLLRIANELHAAGLLSRIGQLPVNASNPRLSLLTSREWAVLTRLLDGQRAADIAADLVVSQSTVRNHLSSIYAKLRVTGQVDLIRTLRPETAAPGEGGER
jgi:DNA-binding CsgD family transcriptional regulator